MLLSLLFIPLAVGFYLRLLTRQRSAAAALGPLGLVQSSAGRKPGIYRHLPPALFLLGLTFLLTGLARPETFVKLPHVGGTVILAFDVSNSMLAEDLTPTRIEAAKAAARTFVENQPGAIEIGVVAFGSGGLVVQQPTNDQTAVLATIDRLSPQGGTSLGQGIFSALNAISGEALAFEELSPDDGGVSLQIDDYSSAVVVLLTDGENTGPPDPLEIAQAAADAGVRIYPIGIGSAEGSILEVDGFSILTQLNEGALVDIAAITNGAYFHAEDEETLNTIYKNVDLQLTIDGEKMEVTAILAGLGLLLLLLGGLLTLFWYGRMP